MEINGRVGLASARYTRPEVNMIAGVEEVGLYLPINESPIHEDGTACIRHESNALPFSGG